MGRLEDDTGIGGGECPLAVGAEQVGASGAA